MNGADEARAQLTALLRAVPVEPTPSHEVTPLLRHETAATIWSSPDVAAVAAYLAEHARGPLTLAGIGHEAAVINLGSGRAARITARPPRWPRPALRGLLQAWESRRIGDHLVEIVPLVQTADIDRRDVIRAQRVVERQGWWPLEPRPGNVGRLPSGELVILDGEWLQPPWSGTATRPVPWPGPVRRAAESLPPEGVRRRVAHAVAYEVAAASCGPPYPKIEPRWRRWF